MGDSHRRTSVLMEGGRQNVESCEVEIEEGGRTANIIQQQGDLRRGGRTKRDGEKRMKGKEKKPECSTFAVKNSRRSAGSIYGT